MKISRITTMLFVSLLLILTTSSYAVHPSFSPDLEIDTVSFYPNAEYNSETIAPNDILAEPLGNWPMRIHEAEQYMRAISEQSDRVFYEVIGQTHEKRNLYNVFISSPQNLQRLDEFKNQMDKLADPTTSMTGSEINKMTAHLPAFAWLGYSIHGDEISGMDAAVQLMYHMAASRDSATLHLLDNVIIIINPSENPDGRERYLSMLQTYRSSVPNYDRHSQQHGGVWPWGRGNHYLFDLNRDWILLTQPETMGRLKTILKYNPVMVVDAHEMGSGSNFLFSPPRQPVNYNTPDNVSKWLEKFSGDQEAAFDSRGWPYYVGEWHEQWYPGYGSAWASFLGTITILYEQAGVDGKFVKQPGDYLLSYHEAVNHQFTSSLTNLFTVANNRQALLKDYRATRKQIFNDGKKSGLKYIFIPDNDELKMKRFIESLTKQGIKVEQAQSSFVLKTSSDIYSKIHASKTFPKGTYIVNTAQAAGGLAKAVLEFDPHLRLEFLKEERKELEKYGNTRMYEVSTWSTPLAYDIDAYKTTSPIKVATTMIDEVQLSSGKVYNREAAYGFAIDMEGEKTFQMLNYLFQNRLIIHASEKPFTIEGRNFNSGSLMLRKRGNDENMVSVLSEAANLFGINVYGLNTGASSEGSYLGAGTFRILRQPKVALLTGSPLSTTSFGSLWYALDKELQIPHSLISIGNLGRTNLDKYNVVIIPSSWGSLSSELGKSGTKKLQGWIKDGGTLICTGQAAVWAADSATGISAVRLKRQSLDKLEDFKQYLKWEKDAENVSVDTMDLWHTHASSSKTDEDDDKKESSLSIEDAKKLEVWERRFAPQGAILRAEIDHDDWLSFGMKKDVPVMVLSGYAFLAKKPVTTSARFASAENLRVSGLLWKEARKRFAETVFLTHERSGKGQIILFTQDPNMRAYFYSTRKMFFNAVLYGPGMGSSFSSPY